MKLLEYTPLNICGFAIRTAWNSHHLSAADKEAKLIDRVGNKFKHRSVLEHIKISYESNNHHEKRFFYDNDYSRVYGNVCVTNMRVLIENKRVDLVPDSLMWLYDESGEATMPLIEPIDRPKKTTMLYRGRGYRTFYIRNISRALLQELARHRVASLTVRSTRYTLKELKDSKTFLEDDYDEASRFIVLTGNEIVDRASIKALNTLQDILQQGISNDIAKYCLPECYKTELIWTISDESLENFLKLRSDKAALWEIRELAEIIKRIKDEN